VEVHPRRPETALRQFCAAHNIDVVAYASLGCGDLLQHPVVKQLAVKNHKSAAQVGQMLEPLTRDVIRAAPT
jgi:diketogulonate reductase-like aldo/keto reductase